MCSYDLIHRRLLASLADPTCTNIKWIEASAQFTLPFCWVFRLPLLFSFLRLLSFECFRVFTLVVSLGIEQLNVIGILFVGGVHLLIIFTKMAEAVCDDHHSVILIWLFFIWQEHNVLFGVNDSHFVLLEKFEEASDKPAAAVGGVNTRNLTDDDDIVEMVLGMVLRGLLMDLFEQMVSQLDILAEEVKEV